MRAQKQKAAARVADVHGSAGRLWSGPPGKGPRGDLGVIRNLKGDTRHFVLSCFNRRGDRLVSVDQRGTVYAFHLLTNRYSLVARAGSRPTAACFSRRNAQEVVVAFADASVRGYDTDQCALSFSLKEHAGAVTRLAFSANGRYAATVSRDRVVLWDTQRWNKVRSMNVKGDPVGAARFLPGSDGLVTSFSRRGALVVWDLPALSIRTSLGDPAAAASSPAVTTSSASAAAAAAVDVVAVSSNGRYALAGGRERRVRLWEAHVSVLLRAFLLPEGAAALVQAAFLPNSDVAALLGDDGTLTFANVISLRVLLSVRLDRRRVVSFAIGSSGKYASLVASDGAIHLFDLEAAFEHEVAAATARRRTGRPPEDRTLRSVGPGGSENTSPAQQRCLDDESEAAAGPAWAASSAAPAASNGAAAKGAEDAGSDRGGNDTAAPHSLSSGRARDAWPAPRRPASGAPRASARAPRATRTAPAPAAPLARLAEVDPKSRVLSARKLKSLLRAYGAFPDKHRLTIWRFLMQLPENVDAHDALWRKGTHPSFASLHERFPMRSGQLLRRLSQTLSVLAHWCPLFAEVDFLPSVVYPFARLYQHDRTAGLETSMCFVLNWTRSWYEFHPNPPVTLLRAVERVLAAHDAELVSHLEAHGAAAQTFLWSLVRTLLTEVLSRSEWLVLFDHVLASDPTLLYYAVVAYVVYQRATLLTARTRGDFSFFLEQQHPVLMPKLVRLMYRLRSGTDAALAADLRAASKSDEWQSLPEGAYPVFPSECYPRFVVDFQLQERDRIAREEAEIEQQRHNLEQLSRKNDELRRKQEAWSGRQQALLHAEEARRERWLAEEEARARERRDVSQRRTAERLRQLRLMEKAAFSHIEEEERLRDAELARLEDEAGRRRKKDEHELKAQAESEAVEALEFDVQQRLIALQREKERQEAVEGLRREADGEARRREAELRLHKERWLTEDEESRARVDAIRLRQEELLRVHRDGRARRELERKAALEQLERDASLTQVERERRVRRLAQEELLIREREASEKERQQQLLLAEEAKIERALLAQEREMAARRAADRAAVLEEKKAAAEAENRRREAAFEEAQGRDRLEEFKAQLREKREGMAAGELEEEAEVNRVLLRLEEEKALERRHELQLLFKQQELKDKMAFQRVLVRAEDQVVSAARDRYARMRAEMGEKMSREEAALIAAHQERMARLIVKKERLLRDTAARWHEGVREDELRGLHDDYVRRKEGMEATMSQFRAEEEALISRVRALRESAEAGAPPPLSVSGASGSGSARSGSSSAAASAASSRASRTTDDGSGPRAALRPPTPPGVVARSPAGTAIPPRPPARMGFRSPAGGNPPDGGGGPAFAAAPAGGGGSNEEDDGEDEYEFYARYRTTAAERHTRTATTTTRRTTVREGAAAEEAAGAADARRAYASLLDDTDGEESA